MIVDGRREMWDDRLAQLRDIQEWMAANLPQGDSNSHQCLAYEVRDLGRVAYLIAECVGEVLRCPPRRSCAV